MKMKTNFFTNVLVALAVVAFVLGTADMGSLVATIVTKIIAAVAAWLCWFEYKRWKAMGLLEGFDVEE